MNSPASRYKKNYRSAAHDTLSCLIFGHTDGACYFTEKSGGKGEENCGTGGEFARHNAFSKRCKINKY